ncbi:MAG TPA: hypothetical protein VFF68_06445, partial [Anaerolineaceae bacterium]|nr:hypothetical protein [Anaerolineaceae bacterium]
MPEFLVSVFASLFTELLIKQLLALLGLILFQVVFAIALAIREREFDWQRLADFLWVMVTPLVIGWLAFAFITRLIAVDLLGP